MTKHTRLTFLLIGALTGVAILLRLLYLKEFSTSPLFTVPVGPDVEEYVLWARQILSGRLLWNEPQIHAPLYPFLLAACLHLSKLDFGMVRAVQLGVGLLSVIPLLLAMRTAGAGRRALWLLALLWAWYPPLIFYESELTSEAIIVPLLSCALFFLSRSLARTDGWRPLAHLGAAGLFSGLACASHPSTVFFVAAETLAILLIWRRGPPTTPAAPDSPAPQPPLTSPAWTLPLAGAVLFMLTAALPVLPIAAYNVLVLKEFIPIQANSGLNFFIGNNKNATGVCYLRPGPEWDRTMNEARRAVGEKSSALERHFYRKTAEQAVESPLHWTKLLVRKALYAWNFRELTAGSDLEPIKYHTAFLRHFRWAFALCGPLALAGLLLCVFNGEFRRHSFQFALLTAAFWIAQTLFVPSGRYRVPMLVGALPLAALTLDALICQLLAACRRSSPTPTQETATSTLTLQAAAADFRFAPTFTLPPSTSCSLPLPSRRSRHRASANSARQCKR